MRRLAVPLLYVIVALSAFNAGRHAFAGSYGRTALWALLAMLWMYVALRAAQGPRRPR